MSLLESIHGVAIHPNSDDVTAELATDKIILGKPGGLTLSPADNGAERASTAVRPIFDLGEWRKNQEGNFIARQDALFDTAAAAAPDQQTAARVDLARFYLSRGMYSEAKSILDLALADAKPGAEDPAALIVHSVASILMGRPDRGMKDLANPAIGTNYDSQLWKAHGQCAAGKVGGSARKIQECRIRHHLAADRAAAHRDRRSDARIARGQGLSGRSQARRRAGSHRAPARFETRDFGASRQARRSAWARQGCAG